MFWNGISTFTYTHVHHYHQAVYYTLYICIIDEGVFVDTNGKITKNVVVQWGESPTSVGKSLAKAVISTDYKTPWPIITLYYNDYEVATCSFEQ